MDRVNQGGWIGILLALSLAFAGAGQTQTRDLRQIKVVSVEDNTVVVWDQFGAQEYTVPEDFRFTVDGKEVAISELKPGMEGSADVNKATGVRPVHITEIKMGTVVSQVGRSVTLKDENGQIHKFTQSEADDRGLRLVIDDKATRISQLEPGDELTATVVSVGPPQLLTAADVDASLAGEPPPPAVVADAGTADDVGDAAENAAEEVTEAATDAGNRWLWIVLALIILGLIAWMLMRKRPRKVVTK